MYCILLYLLIGCLTALVLHKLYYDYTTCIIGTVIMIILIWWAYIAAEVYIRFKKVPQNKKKGYECDTVIDDSYCRTNDN